MDDLTKFRIFLMLAIVGMSEVRICQVDIFIIRWGEIA